jgi:hypothetical protein
MEIPFGMFTSIAIVNNDLSSKDYLFLLLDYKSHRFNVVKDR